MPDESKFFQKDIDLKSRNSMGDYLANHLRYPTMNSWNGNTSWANKIKIYDLGLTYEQQNKAWDMVCADMSSFWDDAEWLIHEFTNETGYDVGTNGRSGGYLVLYETTFDQANMRRRATTRPVGDDWADWLHGDFQIDDDELADHVRLVMRFDKLCDDIRDLFIYWCDNAVVRTRTINIPQTVTWVELPEEED